MRAAASIVDTRPANLLGRLTRPVFQRRIEDQWKRSLEALDAAASDGARRG